MVFLDVLYLNLFSKIVFLIVFFIIGSNKELLLLLCCCCCVVVVVLLLSIQLFCSVWNWKVVHSRFFQEFPPCSCSINQPSWEYWIYYELKIKWTKLVLKMFASLKVTSACHPACRQLINANNWTDVSKTVFYPHLYVITIASDITRVKNLNPCWNFKVCTFLCPVLSLLLSVPIGSYHQTIYELEQLKRTTYNSGWDSRERHYILGEHAVIVNRNGNSS